MSLEISEFSHILYSSLQYFKAAKSFNRLKGTCYIFFQQADYLILQTGHTDGARYSAFIRFHLSRTLSHLRNGNPMSAKLLATLRKIFFVPIRRAASRGTTCRFSRCFLRSIYLEETFHLHSTPILHLLHFLPSQCETSLSTWMNLYNCAIVIISVILEAFPGLVSFLLKQKFEEEILHRNFDTIND